MIGILGKGNTIRKKNDTAVILVIVTAVLLTATATTSAQEKKPIAGEETKETPVNQWLKINETSFYKWGNVSLVYAPSVRRFVMVSPDGVRYLDLKSKAWKKAPIKGKWPNVEKRRGTYFQVAWDPGSKKVVFYLRNRTWSLDPKTWALTDHKASPSPAANPRNMFPKGVRHYTGDVTHLIWGSVCVDPVNNEALLLGGASVAPEGTPGFWRYSFAKNKWTRDASASETDAKRTSALEALADRAWALLSRARNRFHAAEADEEAGADLGDAAEKLVRAINRVRATEENDKRVAAKLDAAAAAVRKAMPALRAKPDLAAIDVLLAGHRRCFEAGFVAAPVPPARLNAQMAYDAAAKKIVLFGGDGWDRLYGDTWVYDCVRRRWEQRFPESSPTPRAGSALVYLPKSEKILLIGGYAYGRARHGYQSVVDQWLYDTAENRWTRIADPKPNAGDVPVCGPTRGNQAISVWPAAADENDNVLMAEMVGNGWPFRRGKSPTWLCRVVPGQVGSVHQPDKAPPLVRYRNSIQGWDRHGPANRDKQAKVLETLEPNVWTNMNYPRDAINRDYSTTAYDSRRSQLLYWGGGHSTYMGSDVHHWSLRGGLWSQSYDPEINLNFTHGFSAPGVITFRNRPLIPVHAYQAYAYDPVADLMVAALWRNTFTYDPGRKAWIGCPVRSPFKSNVMSTSLTTTRRGVVGWADHALFLFNGETRSWKKLPLSGKPKNPWCDSSGMCYDSKRDCLWLGRGGGSISRYDMKIGKLARFTGCPDGLKDKKGRSPSIREMTYVPEQDLVLFMPVKKRAGKTFNYCFDPEDGKWYWLELPYRVGKKVIYPGGGYWLAGSLNYDSQAKVVILSVKKREIGRGAKRRVWLLKLDRKTVKMRPIE